jgi:prephenate dehydratase
MTVKDSETFTLLRLRVATEDDPGALAHLLGYFQNLNITPRRIEADFATTGLMHVQIDVCGMSEARLSLIAAKITQHVPVVNASWHRL